MMVEQRLALRNRIIGVILRDARERAKRTKRSCADALGVSTGTITAYEEGRKPISLPELEILAYVLELPIKVFWDSMPDTDGEEESNVPLNEVLPLRHRIIGALIRQARLENDLSQNQLAGVLGCSSGRIAAFEYGTRSISVAELEVLSQHLGVPLEYFLDSKTGPIAEWHWRAEAQHAFNRLPREIQEFVIKPVNIKYLEVAMKLSGMGAGELRTIAESLLDITY
jgi:transcriptional regulator with XRE-family HTH domain